MSAETPERAAAIVRAFLEKVIAYADAQVEKKKAAVAESPGDPLPKKKLDDWDAFARFTRHTVGEIDDGTLDSWFQEIVRGKS